MSFDTYHSTNIELAEATHVQTKNFVFSLIIERPSRSDTGNSSDQSLDAKFRCNNIEMLLRCGWLDNVTDCQPRTYTDWNIKDDHGTSHKQFELALPLDCVKQLAMQSTIIRTTNIATDKAGMASRKSHGSLPRDSDLDILTISPGNFSTVQEQRTLEATSGRK